MYRIVNKKRFTIFVIVFILIGSTLFGLFGALLLTVDPLASSPTYKQHMEDISNY